MLDKTGKWGAEWCCLQGLISKHPNTITVYRANNAATHFVTQLSQLWKYTSARTNMMKNLKLPTALNLTVYLQDWMITPPSLCPPGLLRCAGRTARRPSSQSPPRPCLRRGCCGCCCCGRGSAVTLRHSALPQIAGFRNFPQNNAMSLSAAGIFRLYNRVMMRSVQWLN